MQYIFFNLKKKYTKTYDKGGAYKKSVKQFQ